MKKIISVLFFITLIFGLPLRAQEDAVNTINGEVEKIDIKEDKTDKKEKQPTSADLVKQHQKIEKLEYQKKVKQRELDYLQKKLEEKKKELEKFDNSQTDTKEDVAKNNTDSEKEKGGQK